MCLKQLQITVILQTMLFSQISVIVTLFIVWNVEVHYKYCYLFSELQKFFGSMFFQWDLQMYDVQLNEHAMANTSDLNEELGQVSII